MHFAVSGLDLVLLKLGREISPCSPVITKLCSSLFALCGSEKGCVRLAGADIASAPLPFGESPSYNGNYGDAASSKVR